MTSHTWGEGGRKYAVTAGGDQAAERREPNGVLNPVLISHSAPIPGITIFERGDMRRPVPTCQLPGNHPVLSVCCYENRSPFLLLNGVVLSYLLFSSTLCDSVAGACLVGAGSAVDSWLGEPAVSVLAGEPLPLPLAMDAEPPMAADESGLLGTLSEYSRDSIMALRVCCSFSRAIRSSLMLLFAKK